nr:nuclear localized protein 1 [Ipomoea batatas]
MEEPWEALDVDDSDLPSLLQPCKRLRHHRRNPNSASATSSQSSFTPCSSSTQISEQEKEGQNLQVLQPFQQSDSAPSQPQPTPHRIPGPAGVVQSAMLQKSFDRKNHEVWSSPIPTQDYVRKAVEDSSEFDYDFHSSAWFCALQFIRKVPGITTLRSIVKCQHKVEKVVAVINSSKPNGLGGLMVTLKDPTGTIGASIHPKVLSESMFGKSIIVGTVLVLKEVAIFAPSRSAVYLNITLRNMEKVFCKDSDCLPANAVNCSYPGIDYSGRAAAAKQIFIAEKEMTGEVQCMSAGGVVHSESETEKENLLPGSYMRNLRQDNVEKESLSFRGGAAKGVEEIIRKVTTRDKQPEGAKPKNNFHACNTIESLPKSLTSRDEFQERNEVMSKTQPFVSKAPLPEWTDEQLSELFGVDGVDDFHACNTIESLPKSHTSCEEFQEKDEVVSKTCSSVSKAPLPDWTDEQLSELFSGDGVDDFHACKSIESLPKSHNSDEFQEKD